MLGSNKKNIDQLSITHSVSWYCHVLKIEDSLDMKRTLDIEVAGQMKKGISKRTGRSRLSKKIWRLP